MHVHRHLAQRFDGWVGHLDAQPVEHFVQPVMGVARSCDQGPDLRSHEADVCQDAIELAHGSELRELTLQLPTLTPTLDETGNSLLQILERRHDSSFPKPCRDVRVGASQPLSG